MKILALDLALRKTGCAVLEGDHQSARIVTRHLINTGVLPLDLALRDIGREVAALLAVSRPDVVYIEVPGKMNRVRGRKIETVEALSEAAGVAIFTCAVAGVRSVKISQDKVKEALAWARASKESVQRALSQLASAGYLQGYVVAHGKRGAVQSDLEDAVAIGWAGLRYEWLREQGMVK